MSEPGDRFLIQRIDRDEYLHLVHFTSAGQFFMQHGWGGAEIAKRFNKRTAVALMERLGQDEGRTTLRLAARRT